MGLESFISRNIRNILRFVCFCFVFFSLFELGKLFLKYKKFIRVDFRFLKCKEFFQGSCFPKYKKSFLLGKYKKFLNIRATKFHFLKIKYKNLFWFSTLGLKSALGALVSIVDVVQCSEYTSSSEYTRVPNIYLVLNKLGFWIYQGSD